MFIALKCFICFHYSDFASNVCQSFLAKHIFYLIIFLVECKVRAIGVTCDTKHLTNELSALENVCIYLICKNLKFILPHFFVYPSKIPVTLTFFIPFATVRRCRTCWLIWPHLWWWNMHGICYPLGFGSEGTQVLIGAIDIRFSVFNWTRCYMHFCTVNFCVG